MVWWVILSLIKLLKTANIGKIDSFLPLSPFVFLDNVLLF